MDQALRDEIWRRSGGCCEYCRMPRSLDPIPFHVDHIIARKHSGKTESGNIAIACFACNNQKQSDIAGIDPEGSPDVPVRLFHPRKDAWDEHFAWNGPTLVAKSAIGRVTLYVLGINLSHRVTLRQMLIEEGTFPPN